jgi:hypothetical protein
MLALIITYKPRINSTTKVNVLKSMPKNRILIKDENPRKPVAIIRLIKTSQNFQLPIHLPITYYKSNK